MSRNNSQKPYFTSDQVEAILANFKESSTAQKTPHDDALVEAVRAYIVKAKNEYENLILSYVLDGRYTFTVQNDLATYGVANSNPLYTLLGFNAQEDDDRLRHALKQIMNHGKADACLILRKEAPSDAAASTSPAI